MKVGRPGKKITTLVIEGKETDAKECTGCGKVKPLNEYYRQEAGVGGRTPRCKICLRKYHEERGYKKRKATALNNRAKEVGLPGDITDNEIEKLLKDFNHSCAFCGIPQSELNRDIDIDHFIPLSAKHGGTIIGNLIPLCSSCNSSKGPDNPIEYLRMYLELDEEAEYRQKEFMKFIGTKHYTTRERAEKSIKYLADKNEMTVKDYMQYINKCMPDPKKYRRGYFVIKARERENSSDGNTITLSQSNT